MGDFLLNKGFKASKADPCLFIREKEKRKLLLVLYVDDGLLAANCSEDLKVIISELKEEFKIVEKKADFYLGLEIHSSSHGIKINQEAYARKVLERFNFQECRPVSTPIIKNVNFVGDRKDEEEIIFPYRQGVGALMYLMLGSRPDIAYSVGYLSRFLEKPSSENIISLKRVLRYIAGTLTKGLTYKSDKSESVLECYSDADFGGCQSTGRSTSGILTKYAGGAISWFSQRQTMVATSTTEAEIVAANEATKEIIWLQRLFSEIMEMKAVVVLQVDNTAAIRLAQNPELHRRTKHIAIKHFFIREKFNEGILDIKYVPTQNQLADLMTKVLSQPRLLYLCDKIGLA